MKKIFELCKSLILNWGSHKSVSYDDRMEIEDVSDALYDDKKNLNGLLSDDCSSEPKNIRNGHRMVSDVNTDKATEEGIIIPSSVNTEYDSEKNVNILISSTAIVGDIAEDRHETIDCNESNCETNIDTINDNPQSNQVENVYESNTAESYEGESNKGKASESCNNSSNESLDKPLVKLKSYNNTNQEILIGASLRGKSHIESNTECQDYHMCDKLDNGWVVLVVSDGAGSAKFAERGAKANCNITLTLIKKLVKQKDWKTLPTEKDWNIEVTSIFLQIREIFSHKVSKLNDGTKLSDFCATIMLAVITPDGILAAHIGDGRMGFKTNTNEWKSLSTPHKGEEANQTIFLQNSWNTPLVPALNISGVYVPETVVVNERPQAVVLLSDGCENSAWECSIFNPITGHYEDKNIPFAGFMNPLIESLLEEDESNRMDLFIDILDHGTKACKQERDDKTMLLLISS